MPLIPIPKIFPKAFVYLIIVGMLLAAVYWWSGERYAAGYNAAIVDQTEAIELAQQAAVARARAQWDIARAAAEDNIVIEERIVEVIRNVETEIPVVVERIVEVTPDCADLGADFAGLLNDQIGAGSRRPADDPGTAAEPNG